MPVTFTTTIPAPTNVTASLDGLGATVSWTKADNNTDGVFDVQRSDDGENTWNTIESDVSLSTTTYTDTPLNSDSTFAYRIVRDTGSTTAISATSSVTTNVAPSSLSIDVDTETTITLSWTYTGSGHSAIQVYRATEPADDLSTFTEQTSLATTATQYTDTTQVEDTQYYYKVIADFGASKSQSDSIFGGGVGSLNTSNPTINIVDTYGN
jgi:hypothetical protein